LSTIDQDFEKLAGACIWRVVVLLRGDVPEDIKKKVLVPGGIIERDST
jgi:DNA-binding LacI/PurR family transcriptional regulator